MGVFKTIAQRVVDIAWAMRHGKPVPQRVRSFNSAQVSNLTSSWKTIPKPIDTDIHAGLRKLVARSRHEAQNNDYVRRFLGLLKTNVVGAQGIRMQSRVIDPSGNPDPLASKAIESGWKEWGKKGTADVTGLMSWKMCQRLYIETLARDGEVLIRKIKNWKRNKFRYALQFLDTQLLDVDFNHTLANGNVVRMSVELDQWRRPVAYYFLATNQTAEDYTYMGRRYQRIPAAEVIHDFLPEWVWQTRGVPWVSAGLLRMNMLGGYEEAELVASRASAAKFAVYEKVDEEAPIMDPTQSVGEKQPDGTFVQDFDSGTIEVTPDGYKLNLIDPQHPNSAYKDFVKATLRGIAAGLGVSYNSLANDLEGVNYSSLRHGTLEERAIWMMLQDWMVESFCEKIFEDWLNESLMQNALTVNGRPLKLDRESNYQNVTWQPRRWQWVDPQKEMNANEIAFRNKIKSPQAVIREMGDDPDAVLDDWEDWQKKLADRNIQTEPATSAGSSVMDGENDEEEDSDPKDEE